jgi:hypothetical protein
MDQCVLIGRILLVALVMLVGVVAYATVGFEKWIRRKWQLRNEKLRIICTDDRKVTNVILESRN